jgi:apolipoprotein N-acyltransferase
VAQGEPDVLVNVTNDAWFGDTAEPHLHHQVARMRAIETRRDLVRAVNTGVSGHVSAAGEDVQRTETWVRTSFIAEARLLRGRTLWVILGDWVTALCAGAMLGWLLAAWQRRRAATKVGAWRA